MRPAWSSDSGPGLRDQRIFPGRWQDRHGFVVTEAADKVTIRNADGVEMEIPTKSIEERTKQNVSLMPEGITKELTIRELASLIDYIESLPKQ